MAWGKLRALPEVKRLENAKIDIERRTRKKLYETTTQKLPLIPGR